MNEPYVTNRKMVKVMLLSIVTFGVYGIIFYSRLSKELNKLVPDLPATAFYVPVALVPTMGIWPIIWFHKMSNKIGYGLKQRGLKYSFSAREFWLFDVLLTCAASAGAWIYCWKLCSAMNLLCADENVKLTGVPSDYVNSYKLDAAAATTTAAAASVAAAATTESSAVTEGAAITEGAATAEGPAATEGTASSDEKGNVGDAFKNFGRYFVNTFKKPFATSEEIFEKATIADSVVILAILAVAYTVTSMIISIESIIRVAVVYHSFYHIAGKIIGGLFFPILYMAIMGAATFGLYCAVNALFIKKPKDMKKFLSFAASTGIALLLCTALHFVSGSVYVLGGAYRTNFFALLFRAASASAGLFVVMFGLNHLRKIITDERKLVAAIGIGIAGLYIADIAVSSFFKWANPVFFSLPM